jgi:hypothetical protein
VDAIPCRGLASSKVRELWWCKSAPQWTRNTLEKTPGSRQRISRNTLQHRLSGYTLHCSVRQACRHQPLQGSSSADSDKYKSSSNAPTNLNSSLTTPIIMGQRHQFFAIARINNRYRTLAVIHNQWLYGHSAVRQCLNTMRILSATGNSQGIRRELRLAESKPDSFWEAKPRARGDDKGRVCPFFEFVRELFARCASVHAQTHASTLASACQTLPSYVLLQAQIWTTHFRNLTRRINPICDQVRIKVSLTLKPGH